MVFSLFASAIIATDVCADIIRLTNNSTQDEYPSTHSGNVVWQGGGYREDYEIYYWNGTTTIQLTDNTGYDGHPSVYNGSVTWFGWDGNDYEIYYWDGNITVAVTNNDYDDISPSLYDGTIAWYGGANALSDMASADNEIYYWDGNSIIQVTNNDYADTRPSLYDGTIAWHSTYRYADGHADEIYYWNGNAVTQVTDNNYMDNVPTLYDGTIAWHGWNSQTHHQIYYWDGSNTIQVGAGDSPYLYDGVIVWDKPDGYDSELHYLDGSTITQLTDNNFPDRNASLCSGTIAWQRKASGEDDWEIYYATDVFELISEQPEPEPEPIPEPSTILLLTTGLTGIVTYGLRRKRKA